MPSPTTELAAGFAWLAAVAMGGPNALEFHAKTFERNGARVVIQQTAPDKLAVSINGKEVLTHVIVGYVDNAWVVDLDRDGNPEIAFQEVNGKDHYATLHYFEWRDGDLIKIDLASAANGDAGEFSIKNGRIFFTPGPHASTHDVAWVFKDNAISPVGGQREQLTASAGSIP